MKRRKEARIWRGGQYQSFREMMEDCELRDLGYEGSWYTWERGLTKQTRVRERLDRFMGNASWCVHFPEALVTHMVFKSNHTPILLNWGSRKTWV